MSNPGTVTLNGNNNNNLELMLMEKDKQLIDMSNTIKELNEQNESLSNIIQSKDYEILTLKTEITSMQSDHSLYETKIKQLNERIEKLTDIANEKENELNNIKENNDNQFQEINDAFNNHMKDYENVAEQCQSFEKEINKLSNDLIEKDTTISSLQQMIFDLKRENKKILLLNKSLQEKDDVIDNFSSQLDNEKKKNEQLVADNNEMRSKLNSFCKNKDNFLCETSSYKQKKSFANFEEIINNMQRNFKTQVEQRDKSFNELKKNYNYQIKDNEYLIQFIIDQLKLMEKSIDYNNLMINVNKSVCYNSNNSIELNDKNNSLKFDLIKKNFELIIKKIIDIRKGDLNNIELIKGLYEKEKENAKQYKIELDEEKKKRSVERSDIIEMDKQITNKQREIELINKKIEEVNEINDKLYKDNNILQTKLEASLQKDDEYLDKCISMVSTFLSSQVIKNNNTFPISSIPQFSVLDLQKTKKEKLLTAIDLLISHISVIEKALSESSSMAKENKNTNDNLIYEINQLKKSIEEKNNKKAEDKSNDYINENKVLSQKLKELSHLLQESNKCLEECNEEKEKLIEKNLRLERNLQMLTQSHYEMENNLNLNEKLVGEKIDMNERKNNRLLQELEIKDMHIKSLENLLRQLSNNTNSEKQQQPLTELTGKIVSTKEFNKIRKGSTENIFVPNDKREKELNNFLSKFAPELGGNANLSPHFYSNNNSFSDSLNLSNHDLSNNLSLRSAPVGKIFKSNFTQGLKFNNI